MSEVTQQRTRIEDIKPIDLSKIVAKEIIFNMNQSGLTYDLITDSWLSGNVTNAEMLRYLKGVYRNRERMYERFFYDKLKNPNDGIIHNKLMNNLILWMYENFDEATPYNFQEAFAIKNDTFRALVFTSIDIPSMISELGHMLHKVDGIKVSRKIYDTEGNYIKDKEYDNVYEVHKVNCEKLGVEDSYAIKCWCTSTDKEHWIWIEDQYKDDPLSAVASTFRVPKDLVPHIKAIKRQGDVMLWELKEDFNEKEFKYNDSDLVPLTKEQYFGWLISET